jgi:alpha-N-acetylglucosamine transferase
VFEPLIIQYLDSIKKYNLAEDTKSFLRYEGFMNLAGVQNMYKQADLVESSLKNAASHYVLADPWNSLASLYNDLGQWQTGLRARTAGNSMKEHVCHET